MPVEIHYNSIHKGKRIYNIICVMSWQVDQYVRWLRTLPNVTGIDVQLRLEDTD